MAEQKLIRTQLNLIPISYPSLFFNLELKVLNPSPWLSTSLLAPRSSLRISKTLPNPLSSPLPSASPSPPPPQTLADPSPPAPRPPPPRPLLRRLRRHRLRRRGRRRRGPRRIAVGGRRGVPEGRGGVPRGVRHHAGAARAREALLPAFQV
ncbi:hypothetical protein ACMD2_06293 [Ananas comosus]|uniref:Uncharacterized protein n=1 Tax=Ananas comosus TaxID=4615 RepID=A0A199W2X1_ANACO|nr:hypothetical protein ACMD2_06293 [Ananas comosus]